jgi:RimJ/RimL family protein N-acetyltransferase
MRIVLRPVGSEAGEALAAGQTPEDLPVASDYPTEFSTGIGQSVGAGTPLGPFFMHRVEDNVVVGEIGCAFVETGVVEIGYAVVPSCWGRGYATDAVRELITRTQSIPAIERIIANTPLDRPASGRVLAKAGFTWTGETDDEHEGIVIRVNRWQLINSR